jgi:hypothetical protein
MSVFTAGGALLAKGGGYEPGPVQDMLDEALRRYRPEEDPPLAIGEEDERARESMRRPPAGGLVLYVSWKALDEDGETQSSSTTGDGKYDDTFRRAVGADRLWVRRDEAEALAAGRFPESLARRIARFHLAYVFGGKVRDLEIALTDGRLAGSFAGASGAGSLLGFIEAKDGKVTRFELAAKGPARRIEDCGFAASLTVVPSGKHVPAAAFFTLVDPAADLARILPHRSRAVDYLE